MTHTREDAPNPPGGWNVMQIGQIGWHVVQSGDGWTVSRLFGPSILPQDGKGDAVSPDPVANREGGHGAADALTAATPLPETVLPGAWSGLVEDAIAEAEKAMRKFPQPNYVITKLAEEAGEVVKAAVHCAEGRETPENLRGEMKQCIAMLYRLWVEGDQVHGLASVRDALLTAAKEPRHE